jgi:hypothetical protein
MAAKLLYLRTPHSSFGNHEEAALSEPSNQAYPALLPAIGSSFPIFAFANRACFFGFLIVFIQ